MNITGVTTYARMERIISFEKQTFLAWQDMYLGKSLANRLEQWQKLYTCDACFSCYPHAITMDLPLLYHLCQDVPSPLVFLYVRLNNWEWTRDKARLWVWLCTHPWWDIAVDFLTLSILWEQLGFVPSVEALLSHILLYCLHVRV